MNYLLENQARNSDEMFLYHNNFEFYKFYTRN